MLRSSCIARGFLLPACFLIVYGTEYYVTPRKLSIFYYALRIKIIGLCSEKLKYNNFVLFIYFFIPRFIIITKKKAAVNIFHLIFTVRLHENNKY